MTMFLLDLSVLIVCDDAEEEEKSPEGVNVVHDDDEGLKIDLPDGPSLSFMSF